MLDANLDKNKKYIDRSYFDKQFEQMVQSEDVSHQKDQFTRIDVFLGNISVWFLLWIQ